MTAWQPTTAQILNLDGVRRRFDRFRFELCDRDLNPIGELHPDRSATPTLSVDTGSSSSRRLSGLKLTPEEMEDVNVISDRLRVYMVLQNDEEFRLGTFLWADASRPLRPWGEEHHSELVDFSYILDQQSTRAFAWGRGANPIGVIMIFLCIRAGFELADIAVIGKAADRSLTEPVTWEPGSTWLAMLTDLCKVVGFAPPWFDRDGRMHLEATPDPAKDQPEVPAYGPGTRVIENSITFSDNMLSAANDFAAFDSGTGSIRAGRFQLPASAPHSYQNRGFRVGLTESVQGLSSQAQAEQATRNMARTQGDAFEELAFTSTLDPRHEAWEVVDAFGERWLETSFSMELRSGGKMEHKLKRTSYDVT